MSSLLSLLSLTSLSKTTSSDFYWTQSPINPVKEGIRIAIRKQNFVNPDSAGTKDEIGYIHVVPNIFMKQGWYSVLNVEIHIQYRNQGFGKNLYQRDISCR